MSEEQVGAVLVVGGGIGGMQTSLDLSSAGFKVYLVERGVNIGGTMSKLDKTFPTNDCAMCIMSPKIVEVGREPNIEILANAELEALEGEPGHFKAKVVKKSGYVDPDKCTGCGLCTQVCPVEVPSEYNQGTTPRPAVFINYGQAIPSTHQVDRRLPPCAEACPVHLDIREWVGLIAEGRHAESLALIRDKLPLPGVIGRICDHPCEQACLRGELVEDPISICALKRFVADVERDSGETAPLPERAASTGKKMAVVGAGPAGLSTAWELALRGHAVTIYEANPKPGGMLRYGIPAYRLPREVLDEEIGRILELGVDLQCNKRLGDDLSLDDLRSQYDAVFLSTGLHLSRSLPLDHIDAPEVMLGVDFLHRVNAGDEVELGERVVVIGGGNVAVDVAMTARRLGAGDVQMICLEARDEMPAHEWEIRQAFEDGIRVDYSWGPLAIQTEGDRVTGLQSQRCVSVFDPQGFFNPSFDGAAKRTFPAENIIVAIGQGCDLGYLEGQNDVHKSKRGLLQADMRTLQTDAPSVFAGGDACHGPASAIKAIAAGQRAAESMDRYVKGEDLWAGRTEPPLDVVDNLKTHYQPRRRQPTRQLPPATRVHEFNEIDSGFDEQTARHEAERCLSCRQCLGCRLCEDSCEADAIDFSRHPSEHLLDVGSVILAPGIKGCDPTERSEYGYGRFANVVTSIEFERMLSATGPYTSMVLRSSDGQTPEKVAWIQCVGSRDRDHDFCSSVCCMYAIKEAIIAKEHQEIIEPTIFYMDIRAYGKGFDQYYERAKEHGMRFIRSMPSKIVEDPDTKNLTLTYIDESGHKQREEFGMVVLSVGLRPADGVHDLARRLGVDVNEHGFVASDPLNPMKTTRDGIYVCGAFQAPKDIPETVAQASSASAMAAAHTHLGRNSCIHVPELPPEQNVADQEPRIGVFVCHCGVNIGSVVDVPEVVEYATGLPNVVHAEHNLFTCSQDTQEKMKEVIQEHQLNRVIVSSCSPRTHEGLFQLTLRQAGLNPYLFEMANIRDQCSWVHQRDKRAATAKAKDLVRMAVAESALLHGLEQREVEIDHHTLIIGGGLAGLSAARQLAAQGFSSTIVERDEQLGGNMRHVRQTIDGTDVQAELAALIETVERDELIDTITSAEVVDFEGAKGNFKTTVRYKNGGEQNKEIEHGVTIVATGARERKPTGEYLYGEDDSVLTQQDFDERFDELDFDSIDRVTMIQCVGSRIPERPACSRICCSVAVKNAIAIKKRRPEIDVNIIARDVRTYGLLEQYYTEARRLGVRFTRYDPEAPPEVSQRDGRLQVGVLDKVLGEQVSFDTDLLLLSSAIVPEDDTAVAKLMRLPRTMDGFFLEAHQKLGPVDLAVDGIFLAGMAHGPKLLSETVAQAAAAVSRASTVLSKEKLKASGVVSQVDPDRCAVCLNCVRVCPYGVPRIGDEGCAEIDPIQCRGCGSCASDCPGRAIQLLHFTDDQLAAKSQALTKGECDERV